MAKKKRAPAKRSLFRELMAAVEEMKAHREGRLTLRTHRVEPDRGSGTRALCRP